MCFLSCRNLKHHNDVLQCLWFCSSASETHLADFCTTKTESDPQSHTYLDLLLQCIMGYIFLFVPEIVQITPGFRVSMLVMALLNSNTCWDVAPCKAAVLCCTALWGSHVLRLFARMLLLDQPQLHKLTPKFSWIMILSNRCLKSMCPFLV